ncbi:hypothetical protein [Serratia quinivorans]|uniref:hypothetical protein n=1 Tax=Serratia quinivorans TaxID=137545 RepID=UPI00217C232F|nr:hypothetical protein [Serratia quinivorans]CAI1011449.1 Uncharacterised protein [Serratia quinivorans]CAI1811690.1 Uncharacterised protein [Serratia quinivorans]
MKIGVFSVGFMIDQLVGMTDFILERQDDNHRWWFYYCGVQGWYQDGDKECQLPALLAMSVTLAAKKAELLSLQFAAESIPFDFSLCFLQRQWWLLLQVGSPEPELLVQGMNMQLTLANYCCSAEDA